MQFENAYTFIIEKLENELSHQLVYHDVQHTKDVLHAAEYLAKAENISDYELTLLKTAVVFHDSGFIKDYKNHEEISCSIAREYLPQFEYSEIEINGVCDLIMATQIPQVPSDHLSQIMCDADLLYLGTDKYYQISENLFKEWKHLGLIKNWNDWRRRQIDFLESHQYFTKTATEEFALKKTHNLLLFKTEGSSHKWNEKLYNRNNAIKDSFLILVGVLSAGFAMKGFLLPNHFVDGGITGISLLLKHISNLEISFITLLLNLPFIVTTFFLVNRKFAYKTFICILLYAVCLHYIHYPPIPTHDKILISIFGGFFLGLGGGLIIRAGCALDGIDILALYTGKRTGFTVTEITLAINILIFLIAAYFFTIEAALYSILTFFTASQMLDFVAEGIEAYTGVTIISAQSENIKHRIVNELGRSITVYKGERGFMPGHMEIKSKCDIIFTVITRLELRKLKNMVNQIDPHAFVFANTIKEASGGIIKRRHVH